MLDVLKAVRQKAVIGFVGGSDLSKITEQLAVDGNPGEPQPDHRAMPRILTRGTAVVDKFDYAFAENGLTAYKLGNQLPSQSFIKFLGEDRYKRLVNFILHYLADLDIPIKRRV